jgi:hypothetical protein
MVKILVALLLSGTGLLVTPRQVATPFLVEIRPMTGDRVELRVDGGSGLHFRANAGGIRAEGGRLVGFVAPGTLEITGGEGALDLSSVDTTSRFVLIVKRAVPGGISHLEASGRRAVLSVRGGQLEIAGEAMRAR